MHGMVISNYLIIPPAIVAFVLFMWNYYRIDPENRLTDKHFVLAFVCFLVALGPIMPGIIGYDPAVPSYVLFAASIVLLAVAILWRRTQAHIEMMAKR
jgi:hypothetical protein